MPYNETVVGCIPTETSALTTRTANAKRKEGNKNRHDIIDGGKNRFKKRKKKEKKIKILKEKKGDLSESGMSLEEICIVDAE